MEASNKTTLVPSLLLAALLGSVAASPSTAHAQFRAEASASFQVGPATGLAPVAPPPPTTPPPPPAPPTPPPPPPQPVVTPAPPAPPPISATVTVAPPPPIQPVAPRIKKKRRRTSRYATKLGLHMAGGGILADNTRMGGISGALRLRPLAPLAFDFSVGYYKGQTGGDSARFGDERREIPVSAEVLFFVKSRRFLQLYLLTGHALSFSETWDSQGSGRSSHHVYAHNTAGAGMELRFGKRFALNGDIRGFLRTRLTDEDGLDRPEYVELDDNGNPTGRTTDTSIGGLFQLGGTLYF